MNKRWKKEAARAWHQKQGWLVGCNFLPSCAVNTLEMWMSSTFSPETIEKELQALRAIGMNTVRVFLPFVVFEHEGDVFLENFERFVSIAWNCGFKTLPILFDDCAFDAGSDPVYGTQPAPVYGVHNSRWVPSPGFAAADAPQRVGEMEEYVKRVVGAHREDERICAWDLYNEPGNTNRKLQCLPLLVNVFTWARQCDPVQPLTCGIWNYSKDWEGLNRVMAELSDVINLHLYVSDAQSIDLCNAALEASGRPVLVTEWLHRPNGNTVEGLLPYFAQKQVCAWQWGCIQGRTQTHLNWDTMGPQGVPNAQPALWQHDLLFADGTPYRPDEVNLYRRVTQQNK